MQTLNKIVLYLSILILFVLNKNGGALGLLCYGIVLVSFLHLYFNNLTYAFFLSIVVIANPGRIFTSESFGISTHFLRIQDLYFYLAIFCNFSPRLKEIKISKEVKKILPILYAFSIYQIVVSLMFKLNITSGPGIFKEVEKFKFWIFGVYLLFPVYKIIQYDSESFIKLIVNTALIYTALAIISANTTLEIIRFDTGTRFNQTDLIRTMIQNAEIFKLVIFIAFGVLLINYPGKKMIFYISGLLGLAIPIMGLFRLEIMFTMATLGIVLLTISRSYKVPISKLLGVLTIFLMVIVLFFIIFPKMAFGIIEIYASTFDELSGKAAVGSTQTRTIIELPRHLMMIRNNPVFGVGFRNEWWENYFNTYDWGLTDIPFTGTIALFGILGMMIYYFRFYFLIGAVNKINRLIRRNRDMLAPYKLDIVVLASLGAYFIVMVSFRLFYIGWELTIDKMQIELGICVGLLYGLINKLNLIVEELKEDIEVPEDSNFK
jgi:hypothetical protein